MYNAYAHSAAFSPGSLFSSRHQAGSLDVAELLVPKPDATWSWHGANCTKEGTTPRHTRSGSLHTFRLVSTNPSEKYESVGMMKFPIYGKIRIHVPNHQPALEVSGCPTLKSSMTFFVIDSTAMKPILAIPARSASFNHGPSISTKLYKTIILLHTSIYTFLCSDTLIRLDYQYHSISFLISFLIYIYIYHS